MKRVSGESAESDVADDLDQSSPQGTKGRVQSYLESFDELPELPWNRNLGVVHIVLGLVTIFSSAIVGVSVGAAIAGSEAVEAYRSGDAPPGVIAVCALVVFQLSMFGWPFIVSAVWRGKGVVQDWGFKIDRSDLSTGVAAALVAIVIVPIVITITSAVVGLEDPSDARNTGFLREAEGSPWLIVLILGTVIGAPVVEELFYRGLVQRSLERFGGRVVGVLGSTVLFAIPHLVGGGARPTIVLWVTIGAVGLVFGTLAAVTRRLGASIVAHMVFNSTTVAFVVFG